MGTAKAVISDVKTARQTHKGGGQNTHAHKALYVLAQFADKTSCPPSPKQRAGVVRPRAEMSSASRSAFACSSNHEEAPQVKGGRGQSDQAGGGERRVTFA